MAQFSARVRKETSLPKMSMRDIYLNPTIRQLAAALGDEPPDDQPRVEVIAKPIVRGSSTGYVLTGIAQLLFFLATAYLGAVVMRASFEWIFDAVGLVNLYQRGLVVGAGALFGLTVLPILAKWILIDEWKPEEIRLWSPAYLRFWLVKSLIQANPITLFAASPIYVWYLRMLGAKIGKGVTIHSRTVPVATDLITIGDGAVISRNCAFSGYRAVDGVIQIGPVSLGRYVHVGEQTVLDINTSMGHGAKLVHASALQTGQAVPAGESWHGCPAEPSGTDYRTVPPARCTTLRKILYTLLQLTGLLLIGPAVLAVAYTLLSKIPTLTELFAPGLQAMTNPIFFYLAAAVISLALLIVGIITGLIFIMTVPRLLNKFITPGKVYPLYGFHYIVQSLITGTTNSKFFMYLTGDSSAVVHYLRALGYDLGRIAQSGSNFGTELRHDSPYLTKIGTGTMVSDVLSIMNADYSGSSFRVSQVTVGERNYFGNHIAFPPDARAGDNCLLGTKVLVPIDGPMRENVGLLGSPAFEIPRSVERDSQFDHLKTDGGFRRRLSAKNRHNTTTAGLFLLLSWFQLYCATVVSAIAFDLFQEFGELAILAAMLLMILFSLATTILAERVTLGFGRLRPRFCSIYDPYFWRHERHWKLIMTPRFPGTPLNPLLWRLAGVRIGRRVFDDGCAMPEKTLVTIGDDAILNTGSVIQCHSLEDGTFKSDYTTIGAGTTLGVRAFVHYGVTMGEGSVLDADSFLMKGEQVGAHEWWGGNPANQTSAAQSADRAGGLEPVVRRSRARRSGSAGGARANRVLGVDVARGLALLGMMAVHVFPTFGADGSPTAATIIAGGRSAATFALLAGISLTFLSGGRRAVRGRARTAASAGIAVRAVLIGVIGLGLGYTEQAEVILPYYAALFLLALPLLGLDRRILATLAAVALVVAPIALVMTFDAGLPYFRAEANPTFTTLVTDPLGLLVELLVSGAYPVIAYLAYLLAGLAIGRLDLSSQRVARWLLGGGLTLAVTAWFASSTLLFRLGGITQLAGAAGPETDPARALDVIMWEPVPTAAPNWWWLALRAPHSSATLDLMHTLGSAMALLGFALLVSRFRFMAGILRPLAAAGSMTLTFYAAHLIVLATGVGSDELVLLYVGMVAGALVLGMLLRGTGRQGPLEWLVSFAAGRSRRAVADRLNPARPGGPVPTDSHDVPALLSRIEELERTLRTVEERSKISR
jgi:non-ribosomal peptide synthetase-like protein